MKTPAYISPSLCIGRTFDAEKSRVGSDIFPAFIPTRTVDVNTYTFKYKVIKSNKDVRDLLGVSAELSLLIKANLLTVSGAGQYIDESRTLEGITEVLAVIKCVTVAETVDEQAKPNEDIISSQIGTHFVTGVTYGAEIVASFKFKASASASLSKQGVKGSAEGQLNFQGHNAALEAQLDKLFTVLGDLPDISVRIYDTTLPQNRSTSAKDAKRLIEEFPSRLMTINKGQGIPIQFDLQAIQDIASRINLHTVFADDLDGRLDDLLNCQSLVKAYADANHTLNEEVSSFSSQINKVFRKFRAAICALRTGEGQTHIQACLEAYEMALDGSNEIGKFYRYWKEISTTETPRPLPTSVKLPKGKHLTVVLFGKTGNGKSATGNTILGEKVFEVSASASSVTARCEYGSRTDGREIDVIDTPGVLDTGTMSSMKNFKGQFPGYADHQTNILQEVSKIFAMAPFGFDAVILVVKYGCRFTMEDAHALKMLQALLEEDAMGHMILLLTHGDQAEYEAEEEQMSTDQWVCQWLKTLPSWVQSFIKQIGNRVVLLNNTLKPQKDEEAYRKQLFKLIQVIDDMTKEGTPFINRLTLASKDVLEERIKESLQASGLVKEDERLEREKADLERRMKSTLEIEDRKELELQLADIKRETVAVQQKRNALVTRSVHAQAKMSKEGSGGDVMVRIQSMQKYPSSLFGGCFPASAKFVDKRGRRRTMESLHIGEEVQVLTEKGIGLEPVITFIHHQPNVMQQFLKITTLKNNGSLKITEDHLLFVEKQGEAVAIPARDLSIADTVYVRGEQGAMETDAVHSISPVFEKGVYAPVTLSGTILVNDVHTSCYFDVLSHEWSHRAMGVARAVYHVSPWMLQWASGVGEKDGFPGWCRLVHSMLTFKD